MNIEEFLKDKEEKSLTSIENAAVDEQEQQQDELVVQKAVVESLATDKAEQSEKICALEKKIKACEEKIIAVEKEKNAQVATITKLNRVIEEQKKALEKVGDVLSANEERPLSSQISLLDRNEEIGDRFIGETRDHVIEVLREARDLCEKDGRLRRAQLLEAVLTVNQPNGCLQKKRAELEKLFSDNQNILSGQVINELDKLGLIYKVGENYLLASEIIKRTY